MKNSNYKMKRPTEGYSTEAERGFCSWSGVSDWEVLFKGKKIGIIYKTKSWVGDWGWTLEYPEWSLPEYIGDSFNFENRGYAQTRKDAFEHLIDINDQYMKEGE